MFHNKGTWGKSLTAIIPYKYRKTTVHSARYLVDEETEKVVRKIFNLYVWGYAPTQTTNSLSLKGIPTPAAEQYEEML